MPRKKSKKLKHRVLHDLLSTAAIEKKHQEIKEGIIYESRKENLIYLLIFFIGVALGVLLTISVLIWIISNF